MHVRTLLVALCGFALLASGCGEDASGAQSLVEIPVYDFDGQPERIVSGDRPMVINFFAESCASCVTEMPEFESVHQAVGDRVEFIGVSEDATAAAGRRLVDATGVTYRAVWDGDGTALTQFRAGLLPTTVFITADGVIADVALGAFTEDSLTAKIADVFAIS